MEDGYFDIPQCKEDRTVTENLNQLRDQIKNAMVPLLIRIFEMKLAAQQAQTPPSRLEKKAPFTVEEIRGQLLQLQSDLEQLHLWVQGAEKQIERALKECEEETPILGKERIQPGGHPLPSHVHPTSPSKIKTDVD